MLHEAKLASLTDLESIFKLMQRMQLDEPWSEWFDESVVKFNLTELLQNPLYGLIYLVEDANRAIAYLVICFDYSLEYRGKGAWVDELFVERDHRQQGIGAYLLDLAESASRENGAQFLHLEVGHGNRAIELYRRRGFVDHDRYLMTKQLRPRDYGSK
jgi:GNAT superfamily N-acetyltransferase